MILKSHSAKTETANHFTEWLEATLQSLSDGSLHFDAIAAPNTLQRDKKKATIIFELKGDADLLNAAYDTLTISRDDVTRIQSALKRFEAPGVGAVRFNINTHGKTIIEIRLKTKPESN